LEHAQIDTISTDKEKDQSNVERSDIVERLVMDRLAPRVFAGAKFMAIQLAAMWVSFLRPIANR
jgi:hypothetical protein